MMMPWLGKKRSLVLAVALSLATSEARADEPITKPVELRHDLRVELPATAGLAIAVVGWRLLRDDLEPSQCRWCDGREGSGKVNAVDDWFRTALKRSDTHPANVTSYVLAFGAAPLAAAGLTALGAAVDGRENEILVDIVAVAEGGLSAMLVTEILEPITLRTRPYVHAIADDEARAAEIAKTGAFHSFPAGHVVEAFGLASAAGVVASMRGYRLAPLVWATGLLIGVATAYTRIAADRHYFTDTLAGAAIGMAVGGGVPFLLHRPVDRARTSLLDRARFAATPVPRGTMLSLGWTF
jgi:membrane-associated phospholipid phosphatase